MNWYLFSGYAVFWIQIGLYVLYIQKKQTKLARTLSPLNKVLNSFEIGLI